jgi:hypothetical protein
MLSSTPTSLSSSTWQRLLADFLVCFASGDEGAGGNFGGEGAGGTGGRGSSQGSMVEPLGLAGEMCE